MNDDWYSSIFNGTFGGIGQGLANQIQAQQNAANQSLAQQQWALQQQQSQVGAWAQSNTHAQLSYGSYASLRATYESLYQVLASMTWICTNPRCGKPLSLGKKGKSQYQPKGVIILECTHCGFEFMVQADSGAEQKAVATKVELELAVLRKKVKDFNLE